MSGNNEITEQLKVMEEKLEKDRLRLKKKTKKLIRKEQDRERMRKGNEKLFQERQGDDETWGKRPSKSVNFKGVSPELLKASEKTSCPSTVQLSNEFKVSNNDELEVKSDSTDSQDSQIIMPTQVTPVNRRRKRKIAPNKDFKREEECNGKTPWNEVTLKEEAFDEKEFQLPKEYTSMKLEKIREDIVLNDSFESDLDPSQSLLVRTSKNSSISEATSAFVSNNDNTVIENICDGEEDFDKGEEKVLKENDSEDDSMEVIDASPNRKVKRRRRKTKKKSTMNTFSKISKINEIGSITDQAELLLCERFEVEGIEKRTTGHVLCCVGDKFASFWIKITESEDQKWSKVAELSLSSSSPERRRTKPLLLIQNENICLKIYMMENDTVIRDLSYVVLGFLDPPVTVITAIHCVELIKEENTVTSLISVKINQNTCGLFFEFNEGKTRGCTLTYSPDFSSTSVEHKSLFSVKGRVVSASGVEGLSSGLVGVAEQIRGVAEEVGGVKKLVIWNLDSGLCVGQVELDSGFDLMKCWFGNEKLVILASVGMELVLNVLAPGNEKLIEVQKFKLGEKCSKSVGECVIKGDVLIFKQTKSIFEWNIRNGKLLRKRKVTNPSVLFSPFEVITSLDGKLYLMY